MDIIQLRIHFHDRSTVTTFITSDESITDNVNAWLHGTPGVVDVRHRIHTHNATADQLRKIDRLVEFQAWLTKFKPSVLKRRPALRLVPNGNTGANANGQD